jgi:hypothetical protein
MFEGFVRTYASHSCNAGGVLGSAKLYVVSLCQGKSCNSWNTKGKPVLQATVFQYNQYKHHLLLLPFVVHTVCIMILFVLDPRCSQLQIPLDPSIADDPSSRYHPIKMDCCTAFRSPQTATSHGMAIPTTNNTPTTPPPPGANIDG